MRVALERDCVSHATFMFRQIVMKRTILMPFKRRNKLVDARPGAKQKYTRKLLDLPVALDYSDFQSSISQGSRMS